MIAWVLRLYLNYLTYFRPIVAGARLCNQQDGSVQVVNNIILTMVFGWALHIVDFVILPFVVMEEVYLMLHIFLALYMMHPKKLGALKLYKYMETLCLARLYPFFENFAAAKNPSQATLVIVDYVQHMCHRVMECLRDLSSVVSESADTPSLQDAKASSRRDSTTLDNPFSAIGCNTNGADQTRNFRQRTPIHTSPNHVQRI